MEFVVCSSFRFCDLFLSVSSVGGESGRGRQRQGNKVWNEIAKIGPSLSALLSERRGEEGEKRTFRPQHFSNLDRDTRLKTPVSPPTHTHTHTHTHTLVQPAATKVPGRERGGRSRMEDGGNGAQRERERAQTTPVVPTVCL